MTTISYPAVGTGGFSETRWAQYFDGEDGILNDYVGTALTLTRINTGEIARYSPGLVRVGGYVLEVTANHDLTVSTSAATYYTWACYDPTLNVAGGGGAASAAGPCTLGISSGLPSTTGSKQYVILDKIVRGASQSLTAATVTSYRRWVSTAVEWASNQTLESVESDYPRGTVRYDPVNNQAFARTINAGGSALEWVAIGGGGGTAIAFPLGVGMAANDVAPQVIKEGSWVRLRGNIKRSAGGNLNTGSNVTLGTLAAGYRPFVRPRFIVHSGTGNSGVGVDISPTTGAVVMFDPPGSTNITYISLDGISFRTV